MSRHTSAGRERLIADSRLNRSLTTPRIASASSRASACTQGSEFGSTSCSTCSAPMPTSRCREACWRSFGTHLEADEPRRPGGESAVSPELTRLPDDQKQCIGGCLASKVVEVRAGNLMRVAPLRDLEFRGAQQYSVQVAAGALAIHRAVGQASDPTSVLRIEKGGENAHV